MDLFDPARSHHFINASVLKQLFDTFREARRGRDIRSVASAGENANKASIRTNKAAAVGDLHLLQYSLLAFLER